VAIAALRPNNARDFFKRDFSSKWISSIIIGRKLFSPHATIFLKSQHRLERQVPPLEVIGRFQTRRVR
jgi:hypothetical protein